MRRTVLGVTALAVVAVVTGTIQAQRPGRAGGQPGRFNPLLRLFDADGDGTLTEDEINGAAARLKELDTSKDGKLTEQELRGIMPAGPGGPRGGGNGPRGQGRGGFGSGDRIADQAEYDNPPLPKDDAEKRTLDALEQMRQGPRFANISPDDGRLLRQLAETIGAERIVEIGTSTGDSAVWFALALRKTGGKLYTHEIDAERADIARENFKKAGVDHLITLIEGDAHETVKQHKEPIDILFLDADKQGYIDYLDKLMPLIRPGGLIIAHNMRFPNPDPQYLKAVTKDPMLDTSFLLMEGAGVGVTMKKR